MPCGAGQKLTVMQKARQTMNNVQEKLHELKEDLQLMPSPPVLCPPPPPEMHTCPPPCKPTIRCRPAGAANQGSPCNVRISKKCENLQPSWLCGNDLDKYIGNQEFEGPYIPETRLLKKHMEPEITCPSGKGLCNCSLDNPCITCLMETIKNLLNQLNGDDEDKDSDDCGESCPPPCKKPNDGCCPTKPTCPCCSDIIDKCLLQLCPANPLSPANRCWLIQRGQCMINFAKQKYVAPFCTKPEELLPSQCGQGWLYERKCEPAKRKPEFQFDPYDPFILHDKTCKRSGKKPAKKPAKKK